jgi:hypothetical protein
MDDGIVVSDVQFSNVLANSYVKERLTLANIPAGTVVNEEHPLNVSWNIAPPPVIPLNSVDGIEVKFVAP